MRFYFGCTLDALHQAMEGKRGLSISPIFSFSNLASFWKASNFEEDTKEQIDVPRIIFFTCLKCEERVELDGPPKSNETLSSQGRRRRRLARSTYLLSLHIYVQCIDSTTDDFSFPCLQ